MHRFIGSFEQYFPFWCENERIKVGERFEESLLIGGESFATLRSFVRIGYNNNLKNPRNASAYIVERGVGQLHFCHIIFNDSFGQLSHITHAVDPDKNTPDE